MRQRVIVIVVLIVVVGVLVLINAASYVEIEPPTDSEASPDRSTYNSGPTGTRALYDFLSESGYSVARWRDSTTGLLSFNTVKPATLVIVGNTRVAVSRTESREILTWVKNGGRLVIVDRTPDPKLLPDSHRWRIHTQQLNFPWYDLNPTDFEQMTRDVKPVPPSQPTLLARDVEKVMPSRFAGVINIAQRDDKKEKKEKPAAEDEENDDEDDDKVTESAQSELELQSKSGSPGPVLNFIQDRGALVVDYPHGNGQIILLSDPYIVANNGINRADNLQLALNIVAGKEGLIVFDEFHQGRAFTQNAIVQYFAGTPVLALCGQLALIGLAVIWSRGARFGRPLPLPHVDRRSSLEFVASMAELQQRAKAHDLALENIYGRVRRALVRHAGVNQSSTRAEIARRVATRSKVNEKELESLMRSCEDTINGAQINGKEALRLVKRLREVEARLGLQSRSRDLKQSAQRAEL